MRRIHRRTRTLQVQQLERRDLLAGIAPVAVLDFLPDLVVEAGQQDVVISRMAIYGTGVVRSLQLTPKPGTDFSAIEDMDLRADLRDASGRYGKPDGVYETTLLRDVRPKGDVLNLRLYGFGTYFEGRTGLRLQVTADLKTNASPQEIGARDPSITAYVGHWWWGRPKMLPVIGPENPTHTIEQDDFLYATETSGPTTDTAVENEKNLAFGRFEAYAEGDDHLVTSVTYTAMEGSAMNGQNWSFWADTDGNGRVDTILEKGVAAVGNSVTFDGMIGGGYVVPEGTTGLFEAHADGVIAYLGDRLRMGLTAVEAERLDDGAPVDTQISNTAQTLWLLREQGELTVTEDSTPVRDQFLLGGSLSSGAVLRLNLQAGYEPIDVTDIDFYVTGGTGRSIDRLELYREGESTPFATATIGACGTDVNPDFCTNMQSRQLVIPEDENRDVLVFARTKSDTDGGVSGDFVRIGIFPGSVRSRGDMSSNTLDVEPATEIHGSLNRVVMSKISSVNNANPDANGTSVPTGVSLIGQFKVSAAAHNNPKNGMNDVVIDTFAFEVNTMNVEFSTSGFGFTNKADMTTLATSYQLERLDGSAITGTSFTGSFRIIFTGLSSTAVMTEIDQGTNQTFVLRANIINPQVSSSLSAHAQAFADLNDLDWLDRDIGGSTAIHGTDLVDQLVASTRYES